METSVIIPTYKRAEDLKRCLEALSKQTVLPDEVIVVVRNTDKETIDFLRNSIILNSSIKVATISKSGVVAALNEGLSISKGDIIAFLDDDAAPKQGWLMRLKQNYLLDTNIGGIGGKDLIYEDGVLISNSNKEIVGKVQWFGRVIGNHHLGYGDIREVDVLKGVNMSFRRAAISHHKFDSNLLGTGAQVGNELALCLTIKKDGWKLVYDPNLLVDHYPAIRHDEDKRDSYNKVSFYNSVFNDTYIICSEFNSFIKISVFFVWSVLIGTRDKVGLVQWLRLILTNNKYASKRFLTCLNGRVDGLRFWYLKKELKPDITKTNL